MYNKIRLAIMLIGFTIVVLVALSYSGNVSDTCRSEWNFIKSDEPIDDEKMATGVMQIGVDNSKKFMGKRSPDFDLIIPNFLFGL